MATRRFLPKLSFVLHPLHVAAGLVVLAVPSSLAQTGAATAAPASSVPADVPYVATMTFDVASVRENKDADGRSGITMSGLVAPNTTTIRLVNWDIENLIYSAYGMDPSEIVGLPKWTFPTVFVIQAKGDSTADAKMAALSGVQQQAEHRHMMQALLEERFNLKTHWETKEGDLLNMVLAKGGPKLGVAGSMPLSVDESKMFGEHPIPALYQRNDGHGNDLIAHGCSMGELADTLTGQFGRPVIDKTALTGQYDFVLKYKRRWDSDRSADDLDPMLPLDRALQQELGLKVEAAKGLRKLLVIDHIDKPSEN